jgi:hypothetical protein
MAHNVDNKEMYLQFGEVADGGCKVERSLALRSINATAFKASGAR